MSNFKLDKKIFLIYSIFFIVSLFFIQFHEMWRDELQAWLIARDSTNIIDLFKNLKYEGHPALWHLILYPLTKIFNNPVSMQYTHVIIASGSILVLLVYAPFTIFQKILLTFSYYLFFEYNLISRNYSISVLLIFITCALFSKRNENSIILSFILFLLSQTNVFGLMISICFLLTFVLENIICKFKRIEINFNYRNVISYFIIFFGIIISALQIMPPDESNVSLNFKPIYENLRTITRALYASYLPLPKIEINFWGSKLFMSNKSLNEANFYLLAFGIFIILFFAYLTISYLKSKPSSLFFFLFGSTFLMIFFVLVLPGTNRHHGFLFIILISSLWINSHCQNYNTKLLNFISNYEFGYLQKVYTFIFIIHFLSGLIAIRQDYIYPFSGAQETAQYIVSNKLENYQLVGYQDYAASAVVGYLINKKIFYPQSMETGSFIKWNKNRIKFINLNKFKINLNNNHLLILNEKMISNDYLEIFRSKKSIVRDESFFLYKKILHNKHYFK